MIHISPEAQAVMAENRPFIYSVEIIFSDGTTAYLDEDDLAATGSRITMSSGGSSFPIGRLISRCLTLSFYNFNDQYHDKDFLGATINVTASLELSETTQVIDLGSFTVTEPETYGTTISIVAYDAGWRTDQIFTTTYTFPMSLQNLYRECCSRCNMVPVTSAFTNDDFVVNEKPENMTCRQVFGAIAMLAGGNAVVSKNASGNDTVFITPFDPYAYTETNVLSEVINQTICTEDVTITGISLSSGGDYEPTPIGTAGYILDLTNELTKGSEVTAGNLIANQLVGLTFRPFELNTMSYPLAEFADLAVVTNRGTSYNSFVTDVDFNFKGQTTIKCVADSPVRNSNKGNISGSPAIQQLRQLLIDEKTDRQLAEEELADALAEKGGLFTTIEQDQGGGKTYYFHDQPTLATSSIVWKMTKEAWGVSTNGGQTWNGGMTVDGNTIVNILTATGISADWINAGELLVTQNGNTIFSANKDTGDVYISGDRVFIGNQSATQAIAQISGALLITLSNEMQGIPVDADGDYGTFPDVRTTVSVYYGGTDVTASCTLTYGVFGVSGDWGTPVSGHPVFVVDAMDADSGYVTFQAVYVHGTDTLNATQRFSLFKAYAGADGQPGRDGAARLYFLENGTSVIKQGEDKAYSPSSITWTAYYRDGLEEGRHDYSGLFKVEITRDGTEWETVLEPPENLHSITYTPDEDDIAAIRCTLLSVADFHYTYYGLSAGDNTTIIADNDAAWFLAQEDYEIISGGDQIDVQTTAVVVDISALTQNDVFNVLTNNGEWRGLYYYNGGLYINADVLGAGTLRSHDNSSYWDLETGELVLNAGAKVGGSTGETLSNMRARITTNANSIQTEVTNRTNADTSLSSRITQNANSITTEVTNRTNADSSLSSRITQNANSITSEVTNRTNADNALSSRITQNSTSISSEVTNRTNADNNLSSRITQNANAIDLRIAKNTQYGSNTAYFKLAFDGSAGKISWKAANSIMTDTGALTTQSLTANAYLYVNGNNQSFFKIPIEYVGLTNGEYIQMSSGGFFAKTHNCDVWIGGYTSNNHGWIASEDDIIDGIFMHNSDYVSSYKASRITLQYKISSSLEKYITITRSGITLHEDIDSNFQNEVLIKTDSITVNGRKMRRVATEDYGKRLLYCYETPSPLFGDVGEGVIGSDGLCYIQIDPTFAETINTSQYQVFLQAYGDGRCYVQERHGTYFIVAGTPDMAFGWEIKAKQCDFDQLRLERDMGEADTEPDDYAEMAMNHIEEINNERGAS